MRENTPSMFCSSSKGKIVTAWLIILGTAWWTHGQDVKVTEVESYQPPPESTTQRTISASGQYNIYGPDGLTRSAFANSCEDLHRNFHKVMGLGGEDWRIPWVIEIYVSDQLRKVPRRAKSSIHPLPGDQYRFQLDVLQDPDFHMSEFESEFLSMKLLEIAFDQENLQVEQTVVIPHWLKAGLEELVIYRESGKPTEIFKSLIEARQIMTVDELLVADPDKFTDSVRPKVFRASSAALLAALLEPNQGSERLRAFLQDLAAEKGVTSDELIRRHFNTLRQNEDSLKKWWVLQMATMSQRTVFEFFSVVETEQFLSQALTVRAVDFMEEAEKGEVGAESEKRLIDRLPSFRKLKQKRNHEELAFETGTLSDFESFIDHPKAPAVLERMRERLLSIKDQVFPVYRPILVGYDQAIGRLLADETKDASIQISEMELSRTNIQRQMADVTRYLNWFAATQVETHANSFDSYEKAENELEELENQPRTDPISLYLENFKRLMAP